MTDTRNNGGPAAEVEKLGRFDHHPDPAIDFCIEVECLQSRLFNAMGGLSKPGTEPEPLEVVFADIEKAMRFNVGADEGAVVAKATLRGLRAEALATRSSSKEA